VAERATVTQGLYIGAEASPGDGGDDFKVLNSFDLTPGVKVDMQRFRPQGRKLESIIVPGKEWTEFKLDGMAEYSELHYLQSGIYGANQVSQPATVDTTGRSWKYILSAQARDDVQTYGLVKGDSDKAEAYSYVLLTELSFDLSREGIKMDGSAIGHAADFDGELPHPFDSVEEVPVLPTEVCVYLDDTFGALGDTKLSRAFQVKTTIGDRHNPVWVLDCEEPSYIAHVELAPKYEFEITLEANSEGTDLIESMRGGDSLYLRVQATSDEDAGATPGTAPYSWTTDAAVKIADVGEFEDADGVYALKYTFAAVYDGANDFSVESEVVNKQADF